MFAVIRRARRSLQHSHRTYVRDPCCMCFSQVCDQLREERKRLLFNLYRRKFAGEEVWLKTLAGDVDIKQSVVKDLLEECEIDVDTHNRHDYVKVPGPDVLRSKLLAEEFPEKLLEGMQARVNGEVRTIKWLQHPFIEEDGNVSFKATWSGKDAPSAVMAGDLNDAARYYVRTLCPCLV